jgi:hypothetical protein
VTRRQITLRTATPLARGVTRIVYQHPDDPALLIKVLSPEFVARRTGQRYNPLKRARMNSVFAREMNEQLVLLGRGEDIGSFLQRVCGFCDTDLGLGMVVEKICDHQGKPAPSLRSMLQRGPLPEEARLALERFYEAVLASDIVLRTLDPRNLLYGWHAGRGWRFVLVDDFGESRVLQWRGWSRSLNARSKRALIAALRRTVAAAAAEPDTSGRPALRPAARG